MNLDAALGTFLQESRELLQEMEASLLALDGAEEHTAEGVNAVFRAAHTIKGSAGLFGLDGIVAFTHVVESTLDAVRDERVALNPDLIGLLLECRDHIGALVEAIEAPPADPAALDAAGGPLKSQLERWLGQSEGAPVGAIAAEAAAPAAGVARWRIDLAFGPDVLRNGMDPVAFIRYLGSMGNFTRVALVEDGVPALEALDPESCHLAFELDYESAAGREAIVAAFDFVKDDCKLVLTNRSAPATAGAVPVAPASAGAAPVPAGAEPHAEAAAARGGERTVRVDAAKLDKLIDLVGELIIAGAGADLLARGAREPALAEATARMCSLVEEVRGSALQLRMVKIGGTFDRFKRVVRDVSRDLGKDIALVIKGEDTELDKTVVERIGDPLMHLVRNAMDHGIEGAEARAKAGKPAQGTLTLNAYHDSGSIVIEVSDDGGGLRRERILAKAIERGLVAEGTELTDREIYNLVFEPGFSTADAVTNLSGRGVGMDVVKRNIAALRGSADISSRAGQGTTVTIRLPLTLAIIDGFLVATGKSTFVVPLETIEECIAYSSEPGRDYTNLRGQALPFVRLRELFEVEGPPPRRESIVVVRCAGMRVGLVVDTLLGEFQTVIKPLGKLFANVRCLAGSTILGNGEVALILDVPSIVRHAVETASAPSEA